MHNRVASHNFSCGTQRPCCVCVCSPQSRQSLDDALELSSQLGVGAEAVIRELAGLPADVPLDSFYSRIVAREGRPLGLEQCKSIFDT